MIKEFTKGLIRENPVFVLALGLCPALGVSSRVVNALGMGAGVLFVLLGANIFVSLLKDFIPEKVRIPSYIVIIASFVTIVEMVMKAYLPDLYDSLGVFVSLIVVNCIILGRAEGFANRNGLGASIMDALGMSLGFTVALLMIAFVREVLGVGTITLFPMGGFNGVIEVPILVDSPARVFALAAGALLVMGYLIAGFRWMQEKVGGNS
ncbi:MAG TPA: electron transport complex subunit E [Sediminispirochaeta sp.]|nr:electron transport complex subunit E [Sediminispirochaeta sp.]